MDSRTKLLERGWTLSCYGVVQGEGCRWLWGYKPPAEHHSVGVIPGKQEGCLTVAGGKVLTVVCAYAQNSKMSLTVGGEDGQTELVSPNG